MVILEKNWTNRKIAGRVSPSSLAEDYLFPSTLRGRIHEAGSRAAGESLQTVACDPLTCARNPSGSAATAGAARRVRQRSLTHARAYTLRRRRRAHFPVPSASSTTTMMEHVPPPFPSPVPIVFPLYIYATLRRTLTPPPTYTLTCRHHAAKTGIGRRGIIIITTSLYTGRSQNSNIGNTKRKYRAVRF